MLQYFLKEIGFAEQFYLNPTKSFDPEIYTNYVDLSFKIS